MWFYVVESRPESPAGLRSVCCARVVPGDGVCIRIHRDDHTSSTVKWVCLILTNGFDDLFYSCYRFSFSTGSVNQELLEEQRSRCVQLQCSRASSREQSSTEENTENTMSNLQTSLVSFLSVVLTLTEALISQISFTWTSADETHGCDRTSDYRSIIICIKHKINNICEIPISSFYSFKTSNRHILSVSDVKS